MPPVAPDKIAEALAAMPGKFEDWVHRGIENAGAGAVDMAADHLIDYAFAKILTDDPQVEQRDTWAALREAASLSVQLVRANEAVDGDTVDIDVDYLGVGHGFFVNEADGTAGSPSARTWIQAFALAFVFRERDWLTALTGRHCARLGEKDPETPFARALAAVYRKETADFEGVDSPALEALARGDQEACAEALTEAFTRYEAGFRGWLNVLVPWDLLALAALAHRRHVPVRVDTVHCPRRLMLGTGPWTGAVREPVRRPSFPAEQAARDLENLEQAGGRSLDGLFGSPYTGDRRSWQFTLFAEQRLRAFALRSLADTDAEDPRQRAELVLARQAYVAAFRVASAAPGTPVEVTVGDRTDTVEVDRAQNLRDATTGYGHAVALAMITRAGDDLAFLGTVPETALEGGGGRWIGALTTRGTRTYLAGGDPGEDFYDVTDSHNVLTDESECLLVPWASLLHTLARDARSNFRHALVKALDLHRDYYGIALHRAKPEALVALRPLAAACRAHDRGWEVGVESDYLPRKIIDGSWAGSALDLGAFRGH